MENPFIISTYKHPSFFCDREKETEQLKQSLYNGINTVLLSLRRLGKTGLIKHLFYNLKTDKNVYTFYFDIMNTSSVEEFTDRFANAVLGTFNSKSKRIFNNVLKFFSAFRPTITFDEFTGTPVISFNSQKQEQSKESIVAILNYLEKQDKRIFIAIDEFQQITKYKNEGFEAFLRSHIQHLNNVSFIFSGSQQNILTSMFASYSRPFYQSAGFLKLERIPADIYADFIQQKFKETKKTICREQIDDILQWLDNYTFYVQSFCNKLWFLSGKTITKKDIDNTKQYIINEHDFIYSNLQNILTSAQYNLLKSIALEGGVRQPSAKEFINKYNLGTTSTVSSAIKALMEKELIYSENNIYKVYDVFLAKWFLH